MVLDTTTGKQNGDLVLGLSIEALPTSANGWPPRPFQIVSLLEMLFEFPAGEVADFAGYLFYFSEILRDHVREDGQEAMLINYPELIQQIRERLDIELPLIAKLGLSRTVERIQDLDIVAPRIPNALTLHLLLDRYGHIWTALRKDLRHYTFLWMPSSFVGSYNQNKLFGQGVSDKFQGAENDIMSAGNCYAVGQHTASVFHLTRVLERGLFVLAQDSRLFALTQNPVIAVGVHDAKLETWETLINKVESAIGNIQKSRKTGQKIQGLGDYSGLAMHFRYFKDHWRNPISHSRSSYDEPQALSAITKVKEFMNSLVDLGLEEQPGMVLP